jgi:hypothetical protein
MSALRPDVEQLLAYSVEQYRELFQHAEKLVKMLDACDYSRIQAHTEKLHTLQNDARRQDSLLLPLLQQDIGAWEKHERFQLRRFFIAAILEINALLLPKMHSVKAMFGSELDQLKSGRVMVAGYAPSPRNPGVTARTVG